MMKGSVMLRRVCCAGLVAAAVSVASADGGRPKHITPEAEAAIEKGLKYLAQTQGRDGAWRNEGRYGRYPVAMSALAGLAILMDGTTTTQGRYAPQVDRTAKFFLNSTKPSGLITRGGDDSRPMYGHGFGMLFLSQLYGMSEDVERERQLKHMLDRAVELTARAQSRVGGWIYQPTSGGDEGSVTITQVQALRSCRNAGVSVPKQVIDDAMGYLELSMNSDGGIAYRANHPGPSRPAITAAAACCWFNGGEYDNPLALRAMKYAKDNIHINSSTGHWYYAHLYMAQVLYLAGEEEWDQYFPEMRDKLLRMQSENGSWDDRSVGPVYGTSVALIILQLPYSQLPIMQR